MAATADGDRHRMDLGDNLMMAGIGFQVVSLFFFGVVTSWYLYRRWRGRNVPLSSEAVQFLASRKFRLFAGGVVVAFTAIVIRCIYRLVEMAGGWANPVMRLESAFIALDGW
jgi:hypothetical protein